MPNAQASRLKRIVRLLLCTLPFYTAPTFAAERFEDDQARPNILLITMDDMNWDSPGSYGCNLTDISPNIDGLARSGLRFQYAYTQTSSCAPSRTTLQTGRYPHTTGVLSFYDVDASFPSLPEALKNNGYFTACVNKPRDSSLTDDFARYWDCHHTMTDGAKRDPSTYATSIKEAIAAAKTHGKPFYCVVNIADPHKPFFNDPASIAKGFDACAPLKTYPFEEIAVPPFLPNVPEIREEMHNYYNSVRRGDDCVGAVLDTLQASDLQEDTVIFFLSDHGMPLPFAKSSLYPAGVRTPWIIVWPDKKQAGTVDSHHLVSAIDFMPTILDITGTKHPDGLQGRSLLPLTEGRTETDRDRVFVEFNDNAGGIAYPMRAIHTKDFVYIFNAWATGRNDFLSAATWHQSEKAMRRLASTDDSIAKRYDFLLHRCPEELYRTSTDPHCLHNLIDDPKHQRVCRSMQEDLLNWMKSTDDYLQEAFEARKDPLRLQAIYEQLDSQSLQRAKTLQWKRHKNRAGGTEKNTALFSAQQAPSNETIRTFMLVKGDLLFEDDFTIEKPLTKPRWWLKQGTQWSITNGTLVGTAATEAYQTQRQQFGHHLGDVPRIGMGKLPKTYVLACRFQIDDRPGNSKVPLIEFGHHVSRIYFGKSGAVLLTNHEKSTHTRLADFHLKPYRWYSLLAEVGKEDLVVQLIDDTGKRSVLHVHEPRFAESENMAFEVATTLQGTAKIDDMKVWSAGATKPNWRSTVQ